MHENNRHCIHGVTHQYLVELARAFLLHHKVNDNGDHFSQSMAVVMGSSLSPQGTLYGYQRLVLMLVAVFANINILYT